jgi:hypothetical protein
MAADVTRAGARVKAGLRDDRLSLQLEGDVDLHPIGILTCFHGSGARRILREGLGRDGHGRLRVFVSDISTMRPSVTPAASESVFLGNCVGHGLLARFGDGDGRIVIGKAIMPPWLTPLETALSMTSPVLAMSRTRMVSVLVTW